ncbi:carbohydrate binding family 9 domain-containing protein, partial [bacterium]|nr:carbohydrate binding family 9 domain-containing protein [bacterium]
MKKSKIFITLFILVTVVTTAVGREIKATRIKSAIYTDGRITESEWPESLFQKGFTQMEPDKGQPSLEMTMVAVQYDDHYIYVAFICNKSYPDPVTAEQTRRDQFEKKDDLVAITLDTYHDSRSAYWFMINPLNTQVDARISDDGKTVDTELDAEWDAKAAITDSGWTAEFSIPYRSIRYNPKLSEWGINFSRFIPRKLETSYWSGIMENDFRVSQYGTLTGLVFPESRSELHLIPYTTLRYETFSQDKWNWEIGLDAEYRFQNNITGNLTLNPDFAVVEGDKERINMTRWELSFPEKRKFFLEGSDMFRNRIRAFYSRRIGEIDFGGKVIGKTGPYAFSVIGVRARAVEDNIHTSEDEAFPAYNTAIVRIKRDVLKSSTLGMMIINREWKGGFNRVFSLDGVFNFKREYLLTTQFVVAAPGPLKQNYGGFIRLARENNIYHVHLRYTELAEQFRESVNDVGYIRDDDRRELDSAVSY